MELLLGGMPDAARFVVAFLLVLGLIGAGAFLWRRFGTGTLSTTGPRGRQPRLAVIDSASVDGRRRLVLIRRDNTEHLLLIGGPTDIVVEPNIARSGAGAARDPRPIPVGDIPPRQTTPAETPGWVAQPIEPAARPIRSMEDLDAARSEPAPRSAREAMADTMRAMRSEPAARSIPPSPFRPEPEEQTPVPNLAPPPMPPEPSFHAPAVPEPRRAPIQPVPPPPAYEPVFQNVPPAPPYEPVFHTSPEPKRAPPPPIHEPPPEALWPPPPTHEPVFQSGAGTEPKRMPAPAARPAQTDESNLAEMAQRLEAALRRPTKPVEPPAPPPPARPVARPEPAAGPMSRAAAYFESLNAPKGTVLAPEPPAAPTPEIKPQAPFESLEDEMAKMLGRTPGKT
jgi:flagellar protein FliO/FliZ